MKSGRVNVGGGHAPMRSIYRSTSGGTLQICTLPTRLPYISHSTATDIIISIPSRSCQTYSASNTIRKHDQRISTASDGSEKIYVCLWTGSRLLSGSQHPICVSITQISSLTPTLAIVFAIRTSGSYLETIRLGPSQTQTGDRSFGNISPPFDHLPCTRYQT